jgi:AraC family transcriptional regulator of adaptative response / DNA-3-methyladenine glycosylase II
MLHMSPSTSATSAAAGFSADQAYEALKSRDPRFDGKLFVGVTSTGIYCRPVCRVKLPKQANCRFFGNAAAAEQGGFRPCLRCRPELAPGLALSDSVRSLAHAGAHWMAQQIAQGEPTSLPALAAHLGVSERHVRRIFAEVHGVSPLAWATTQRLLWAKCLLTDTALSVAEVAQSSGFGSVRRFNAALAEHYHLTPSTIRRQDRPTPASNTPSATGAALLRLPWRAPYEAGAMQAFLAARPLTGVEAWAQGRWWRTLRMQAGGKTHVGWLALSFDPARGECRAEVSPALAPCLGQVAQMLRHLLDLDTDTQAIDEALGHAPLLPLPGLRIPGCVDGFETTVRIILGQQITVAAACTLTARLVARWGETVETPLAGLDKLFPSPQALLEASADEMGALGVIRTRTTAIKALADAVLNQQLVLRPGQPLGPTLAALKALPGIGEWTAQLVALRVLAWPDAFPASDAGVLKALGGIKAPEALAAAQAWQPWRGYATLRLWHALILNSKETSPR